MSGQHDRNRNNRRNNRRDSRNGGGGGDGCCGSCCCHPCSPCNLSNRCGTFIIAIICTIWAAFLVLMCTIALLINLLAFTRHKKDNGYLIAAFVGNLIELAIYLFLLIVSICLICVSKRDGRENRCKVYLWLMTVLIYECCCVVFFIAIYVWYYEGYDHNDNDIYYGATWWYPFSPGWFSLIWIWYPWWIAYAYWVELGGRSWCNCNC